MTERPRLLEAIERAAKDKKLRAAAALGIAIGVLGLDSACGRENQPNSTETRVVSQIPPESTKTPDLSTVTRENYLEFFKTPVFYFQENDEIDPRNDVLRSPVAEDGEQERIVIEQVDAVSGNVIKTFRKFEDFAQQVSPIESEKEGVALAMARDHFVVGQIEGEVPLNNINSIHVKVLRVDGGECQEQVLQVLRNTGEITDVGSSGPFNFEGEKCNF